MAAPTGIAAQAGIKSESTYGTAVVVDQFLGGFLSESITQEIDRIVSNGLRAGRRTRGLWKPGGVTVGGTLDLELHNQPLATFLTHMFGTVVTTGTGPYTHTATPGSLTGKSFTLEIGRPDEGGTVRPFVYAGCKVDSWTLSSRIGEIASLSLDIIGQSEATGGTLATASYAAAAAPFVFTEATLTIAGSSVATCIDMSLTGANNLAGQRHRMGSALVREPLENGFRDYTGTVTTDFEDLTAYNRFVAGTESALVATYSNGTDSLTITCNVRYDGETPTVDGPEMLRQTLPFVCTDTDSDADAITAVLVNGETSAA